MKYSIEIYLDEADHPDFSDEGSVAFPTPSTGDFIHPAWQIADGTAGYYPGDRYRVVRVEHVISVQSHRLMVYCEGVPGPQNPGFRG